MLSSEELKAKGEDGTGGGEEGAKESGETDRTVGERGKDEYDSGGDDGGSGDDKCISSCSGLVSLSLTREGRLCRASCIMLS